MITVGATVLALFPLALHGGPLWQPLCYTQIGGLAVATFITLLLVPVLYAIFVMDLKILKWETKRETIAAWNRPGNGHRRAYGGHRLETQLNSQPRPGDQKTLGECCPMKPIRRAKPQSYLFHSPLSFLEKGIAMKRAV